MKDSKATVMWGVNPGDAETYVVRLVGKDDTFQGGYQICLCVNLSDARDIAFAYAKTFSHGKVVIHDEEELARRG